MGEERGVQKTDPNARTVHDLAVGDDDALAGLEFLGVALAASRVRRALGVQPVLRELRLPPVVLLPEPLPHMEQQGVQLAGRTAPPIGGGLHPGDDLLSVGYAPQAGVAELQHREAEHDVTHRLFGWGDADLFQFLPEQSFVPEVDHDLSAEIGACGGITLDTVLSDFGHMSAPFLSGELALCVRRRVSPG
ncbi:hypothetical protein ACFQX6_52055 [Streptosporangium lutulentum]